MSVTASNIGADARRYIVFGLGGCWVGFRLATIVDVEDFRPDLVTPHPLQGDNVLGVVPHRGQMATLFNARKVFGLNTETPQKTQVSAMVELFLADRATALVGMVFDELKEIVFLESNQEVAVKDEHQHLAAFIERTLIWRDEVLTLFDLPGLLAQRVNEH